MKKAISNITPDIRYDLRRAVKLAVAYWPNAHLGDNSPRQDIRSAFGIIRRQLSRPDMPVSIQQAIDIIEMDAYRHADM